MTTGTTPSRTGTLRRWLSLAAAPVLFAACSDVPSAVNLTPVATPDGNARTIAAVSCTATLRGNTVQCGVPSTGGGALAAITVGGQNRYVDLTSSNVAVVADTFAFDVTVENLIPQPLGTTDGVSNDPNGVRVFFNSGPTGLPSGTVAVANADGTGNFTGTDQPYYQYASLAQNDTSEAKRWKLVFTPGVETIRFTVYVSAEVQFPDGYVTDNPYVLTLNPNETRTLSAVVRNAVGDSIGTDVTYESTNPGVVTASGNQATAGASAGQAELNVNSGTRPAAYSTAVSVCQSQTVANGASISGAIAGTDCLSAFGAEDFRPSAEYFGDLYRVNLQAGQEITITMTGGTGFDSQLTLVDNLGFAVAYNDDIDFDGGNYNSQIVFTAPTSGTYVFEASSSFYEPGMTGSYTLTVSTGAGVQ